MIWDTSCRGYGIFSRGNIKPVNRIDGTSIPIREISIADCWETVLFEINKPNESAVIINRVLMAYNRIILPLTGTPNTNTLSNKMTVRLMSDKARYGSAFETITKNGLNGDTSNTSIVPLSFSLTMETEVISTQTSSRIRDITPGTKLMADLSPGL